GAPRRGVPAAAGLNPARANPARAIASWTSEASGWKIEARQRRNRARVFQLRMQTERAGAPLRSTGVSMLGSLYHGPREASNSDRILDGQARARKRAASVPIPAAATGPVLGPLVCMESSYPEDRNRMVDMQRQYRSARALGSLLFLLVSSLSAIYAQRTT